MKTILTILALTLLVSCAKTDEEVIIHETKCDITVEKPISKVSTYYASQGLTLVNVEIVEAELCKSCECKTGRIFYFQN